MITRRNCSNQSVVLVCLVLACLLGLSHSYKEEELIVLQNDVPIRLRCHPGQWWTFTFNESQFEPNKTYHIKYSWIGSIGAEIRSQWKYFHNRPEVSYFFQLDSNDLDIRTNEKGQIIGEANEFGRRGDTGNFDILIIGFRNTRSRDLKALNDSFEFIIRIEETTYFNAPIYLAKQLVLAIAITLAATITIWMSYINKKGFIGKIFVPQESATDNTDKKND